MNKNYPLFFIAFLCTFISSFGQTIIKNSFEQTTTDTWSPINFSTPACTSGADRWDYSTNLSVITPNDGNQFWGIADLNGNCGGADFETITFPNYDVSAYTTVTISFDYYIIGFDNGDDLGYEVWEDGVRTANIDNWSGNTNGWNTLTHTVNDATSSVSLILKVRQNGGDYAAFDNVLLEGIATSGNLISVTQATGGSISPGNTVVDDNNNQSYTASASTCYTFNNWIIDGTNAGSINPYIFNNVITGHTITASYTSNTYSITASAGNNGSITPSGTTSINCGTDQTYVFIPDPGYTIDDVLVDGISVGNVSSYDFINITSIHTISVSFITYVGPCFSMYGADFNNTSGFTSINGNEIRLASGSNSGTITTDALIGVSDDVTVQFNAQGWDDNENEITVTLNGISQFFSSITDNSFNIYSANFTGVPDGSVLEFSTVAGKRVTIELVDLYCTASMPQPEINLQGNTTDIPSGSITISGTNDTDFGDILITGGSNTHTFTIENTGDLILNISSITSSLIDFTINSSPLTIPANSSETFTVTFDPNTTSIKTATITIHNDDTNESAYTFNVEGNGTALPVIVLSSSNPAFIATNIIADASNSIIYQFDLSVTNYDAELTAFNFVTMGTALDSDITNFKGYYSADATLTIGTDTYLDTVTTSGPGSHTFSGFSQTIANGSTGYIFITADLPCDATPNKTIITDAITPIDLSFTNGTATGLTFISGTHTITEASPNNLTALITENCENGSVDLSWTNAIGCLDNYIIVASTNALTTAPTGDSSTYLPETIYGSGTAYDNGYVVYNGTGTSASITNLTNGINYIYTVFSNNGNSWSSGISVNCTPILSYCTSGGANSNNSGILNVSLNTLNNSTTSSEGYTDYTNTQSTNVNINSTYSLNTNINTNGNYTSSVMAWIDWNQNGNFTDSGEEYQLGTITNNTNGIPSASPLSITVPSGATIGNTRMRIIANSDNTVAGNATACENFTYGEVEDYTIKVIDACTPTHTFTSMLPTSGPKETKIIVTGAGYTTNTTANFGSVNALVDFINATTLIVYVPSTAETSAITITEAGCNLQTETFTIIEASGPCAEIGGAFTDLIISEVYDSNSANVWYMELYNPTSHPINLSTYAIERYSETANSGAGGVTRTINLTGLLAANSIYTLNIGSSTSTCTNISYDVIESGAGINELDTMHLTNNGVIIDIVVAPNDTGYSIFRNPNAAGPTATYNPTDWTIFTSESCADLGSFTPVVATTSPLITPIANSSDCSILDFSITSTEGDTTTIGDLTYQWYFNDGINDTWSAITSTLPSGYTILGETGDNLLIEGSFNAIDNLINYQFFCEVTEASTCTTISNADRTSSAATTWINGVWSNGIPNINTKAIINDNYNTTTNGSFSACSLTINSNPSGTEFRLTVNNSTYVEVENDVIVNGELHIETQGNFVQNNNVALFTLNAGGTSLVNKNTTALNSVYEYTYWSSPVENTTINQGLASANPSRRYAFNAANYLDILTEINNTNTFTPGPDGIDDDGDDWFGAAGNTIMTPGIGYISMHSPIGFTPGNQYEYTFEGPFNTGLINTPIFYNGANGDEDWNLIGNPYPSAIDANAFLTANAGTIKGLAYLWSHSTPANTNASGNQAANFTSSDYAIITLGSGNVAGGDMVIPNDYIPSGQSFFVQSIANGNATFNNSYRMADLSSNDQFFRTQNTVSNKIWVNLTSDNGVFYQILVAYVNGATDGKDSMAYDANRTLDAEKVAEIYTFIPDQSDKLAVQGKAPESLMIDEIIPIGFNTQITIPTIYTLSIAQLQGAFLETNTVYLIDYLDNSIHDLSASNYQFTSEAGAFTSRFEIVFNPNRLSVNDYNISYNALSIIELTDNQVEFSVANNLTIKSIKILDLLGKEIYTFQSNNATEILNLSNLSQATYIAQVELSNGQVISKKAIKK